MIPFIIEERRLERLAEQENQLCYMDGAGAEKILYIMKTYQVTVADFFASDEMSRTVFLWWQLKRLPRCRRATTFYHCRGFAFCRKL